MDLGFIGASRGERTNTEQKRGGRRNRGAGDGLGHLHLKFLLMIKIADERLNKVSHLTVKETATLLRLLQGDWEFVVRPTMQDCKEPQSVEQEARSSRGVIPFNHTVAKDKTIRVFHPPATRTGARK
jgi:hypothetical protein